ncbi:hypothetical protein [Acidicapsa acidisoli]|uniref:hypothetical protein n=1 Tax=Acidicapsa acidisoli TaxID=1615681 RepID=UPI0021DFCF89|nr:hypothetical protein [Acidicapsa acidisoli]
MKRALGCDVYPLVQDDSGDGDSQKLVAVLPIVSVGSGGKHLSERAAFHMDEGFNVTVVSSYPAEWTGYLAILEENTGRMREYGAVSVEKDGDWVFYRLARGYPVSAKDLDLST